MAQDSTEQLIKEHFATLPEPVKKAIGSFDWAREVFDIGRKHNMHIDRIGELQTEVMLVVLGLTSPADFQTELLEKIEPNRDIAYEVSDEVNKRVFIRIRDFMKGFYENEAAAPAPAKDDELASSEKSVLRGAGISLDGEPEPEEVVTIVTEDEAPTPVALTPDPVTAKVAEAMKAPEVKKAVVSVMTPANVSKNFLDPYREPIE